MVVESGQASVQEPIEEDAGELILTGTALSFGMATGDALFYRAPSDPGIRGNAVVSVQEECERLHKALVVLRDNISEMLADTAIILTEESLEIFDVYRLLVQDAVFEQELVKIIQTGKTAYEATSLMAKRFRGKMGGDSFWKTRLYDMQYLFRQLRELLSGPVEKKPDDPLAKRHPIILVASYISPADFLQYYRYRQLAGLVLRDGGPTSHTAIVARSLHIPALGGVHLTRRICQTGTRLLIDVNAEQLYVRPAEQTLNRLQQRTAVFHSRASELPLQAVTKDNVKIELMLNANLTEDLELLGHPLLNGVGLFRTEILFMMPNVATDFNAQVEEYRKILNRAGEKPVMFRTVDITGDKELDVFEEEISVKKLPEAQKAPLQEPAKFSKHLVLATPMGKILLRKHAFLRMQIRAMLRARLQSDRPYDALHIMIPMIADAVELKTYQKIIETEAAHEAKYHPSIPSQIKIGVMVEVPALVYQVARFHSLVDFVSIGTNDLFQFFFATNRWDLQSKRTQDVLSPAFLQFIGNIVHQLMQVGIPVHVCGEMAGHPLTAMALLGLGVRRLSVPASSVDALARMINSLSLGLLYPYMRLFRVEPHEFYVSTSNQYANSVDVWHTLQSFAHQYGVVV